MINYKDISFDVGDDKRVIDDLIKVEQELQKEILQKINNIYEKSIIIDSEIVVCLDGVIFKRVIKKRGSCHVVVSRVVDNIGDARLKMGLNCLEKAIIANKVDCVFILTINREDLNKFDIEELVVELFDTVKSCGLLDDCDGYIRSVDDLLDILRGIDKSEFLFRGQINNWDLYPALFRHHKENARLIEISLYESLLGGIINPYAESYNPIDLLINLQHFGVPTRLLDLTRNPLIALFFSCYDENDKYNDKNGILYFLHKDHYRVWIDDIKDKELYRNSPDTDNLKGYEEKIKRVLDLNDICLIKNDSHNPRIRNQEACFLLFSFYSIDTDEPKYLHLVEYIKACNRTDKEYGNNEKSPKIWIADAKVDKDYKKLILSELSEKYDISAKTIFTDNPNVRYYHHYYQHLYASAIEKAEKIKSLIGRENENR